MKVLKSFYNKLIKVDKKLPELLGYGGLIPVLVSCIIIFFNPLNFKAYEIITIYSYAIIAFLGGIYWGVGLKVNTNTNTLFVISIIPVFLILLSSILNFNQTLKFINIIIILNFFLLIEIVYLKKINFINWFILLRIRLNIILTLLIIFIIFNTL